MATVEWSDSRYRFEMPAIVPSAQLQVRTFVVAQTPANAVRTDCSHPTLRAA